MFSGVAIALPHMGKELSMSATSLGLVETTFIASSTAFLLPAGRLVDAASRGAIFKWSLTAFGVLSLLIGCATTGWVVLLLRFLQGLAAALSTAAGPALLMDLVPDARRGRIFGAMLGMAYAGLALGPLAGGWISDHLGWWVLDPARRHSGIGADHREVAPADRRHALAECAADRAWHGERDRRRVG